METFGLKPLGGKSKNQIFNPVLRSRIEFYSEVQESNFRVGLKPLFRDEILEMEHLTANRGRITAVYFLVT